VLFKVAAQMHQRLRQQSPVLDQSGNERATNALVTVQNWMDSYELGMYQCNLDQRPIFQSTIKETFNKPN
jgi:peptide methionine sulfoxide reductase MsrB